MIIMTIGPVRSRGRLWSTLVFPEAKYRAVRRVATEPMLASAFNDTVLQPHRPGKRPEVRPFDSWKPC